MKILILGGTGFLGPACSEAAVARGHKVTLFNRGRRELLRKENSRPSAVPQGVEVLYGNRDPEKHAEDWKDDPRQNPKGLEKQGENPKGLSQLEGKKWDAVIDTSAYFPRIAKASAELLAPNVKQYVFISTISVYKDNSKSGMDETAELNQLADPKSEDFGKQFENYGAGKAACESAIEAAMKGRVTAIRPGFIVGPRDESARFMYWPVRVRRGGEMLVPGDPTDPIQIIDVRDLAEWAIHCIENNTVGTFNATGPAKELSMKEMVEGCKAGAGGDTISYTWVPSEFLETHGVGEGEFPLWIPPKGENAGFHRVSIARALATGLKFRSVSDTTKATLAWYDSLPEELQKNVGKTVITKEREAGLLEDFKKSKG
jgi:2'-hydroxyisoflavone reductase